MTRLPGRTAIPKRANRFVTRIRATPPGEDLTDLCLEACWFGEEAALTLVAVGNSDDAPCYLAVGDALRAAGEALDGHPEPPTHWDATPLTSACPAAHTAASETALAELAEELLAALALLCDHAAADPDKVACAGRAMLFAADAAISLTRPTPDAHDVR